MRITVRIHFLCNVVLFVHIDYFWAVLAFWYSLYTFLVMFFCFLINDALYAFLEIRNLTKWKTPKTRFFCVFWYLKLKNTGNTLITYCSFVSSYIVLFMHFNVFFFSFLNKKLKTLKIHVFGNVILFLQKNVFACDLGFFFFM